MRVLPLNFSVRDKLLHKPFSHSCLLFRTVYAVTVCVVAIKAKTTARCPSNSISFCTDIAALQINFKCCNFHICQRQRTKVCNAQFPLQACTMLMGKWLRGELAGVVRLGGAAVGGVAAAAAAAAEKHLLQVPHFILLSAFDGQQTKSPLVCVQPKTK